MSKTGVTSDSIRQFILDNIESHATHIAKLTAEQFGITRQAVNKHLKKLVLEQVLTETGKTKNKTYKLVPILEWTHYYDPSLSPEDVVWRNDIQPQLSDLPSNVLNIWHYGFTGMFNNVLDHSEAQGIIVKINKTAKDTAMLIQDNGCGIFKKIQAAFNLLDERHALFELCKGRLTTDKKNHTRQGIFFTSRMFDEYNILSGGVFFSHRVGDSEDRLRENDESHKGTIVWMKLKNSSTRTTKEIFDQYSDPSDEDYGFSKTVVPIELARYGKETLVSRSQAKRILARVDLFKTVVFDFDGVEAIGQAFADEIFRVFAAEHPAIELVATNTTAEVQQMIKRAKA